MSDTHPAPAHPAAMPPALVLDEGARGDLGLVRALGLAGVPVHIASSRRDSATRASRFVRGVYDAPPFSAPAAERVARLRAIAQAIGTRPLVMTAGDGGLELISEHRGALNDVMRHDLAAPDVVAACFHKDRFAVVAERLRLPVPATRVPESVEEVRRVASSLTYPVFVKPRTKEDWGTLPEGVVEATKGQRIDSAGNLVRFFERLAEYGGERALIQSYVASPDSEHYSVHAYVLPDGRFAAAFTTRKIRVWPPHRGIGCLVVSARVPELVELSRQALERLGYRGTALLQYKRDPATGRYLLLEVNCRYSTSIELPARCGMNIPAYAHAVANGLVPPRLEQREGAAWLDLERDRAALREYRRLGEWGLGQYLASLRAVRYGAFFRWDDAGPWFRRLRSRIKARVGRASRSTMADASTQHVADTQQKENAL